MARLKSPTTIGSSPIEPDGASTGQALMWNGTKYVPGDPSGAGSFLPLSGGTLTGFLTLHAAPTADLHASTKKYVDDKVAAIPLPYLPLAGGTMTGVILGAVGTVSLPGYSFAGDPDVGFYRIGADNIGVSIAGARVMDWAAAQTRIIDGVVATPSLTFVSDPDTGFWRVTTNTIGISTGGTEVLRLSTGLQMAGGTGAAWLAGAIGTAALPAYSFAGDTNLGLYRSAADVMAVSIGGVAQVYFSSATADGSIGSNADPFVSGFSGNVGWGAQAAGVLYAARAGIAAFLGRTDASTGGGVVDFRRVGVQVGTIALSSGATIYNTSSDISLKKSIKAVASKSLLDGARALRVKQYSFKKDPEARIQRGLLAQEVYEIYPEAVTPPSEDGSVEHWQMDYGRLTPLLLGAIQELADRVDILEAK